MENFLLIFGSIGVLNSLIIIYTLFKADKGNITANKWLGIVLLMITIRIWKSILLNFYTGLSDFLIIIGLIGFLYVGPTFLIFLKAATSEKYSFQKKELIHFLSGILFVFVYFSIEDIRKEYFYWALVYLSILVYVIIYIIIGIKRILKLKSDNQYLKKKLLVISSIIVVIWLSYLLNAIIHFPYITGALVYSLVVYITVILFINRGDVLNTSEYKKYQKNELTEDEKEKIHTKLKFLLETQKVYRQPGIKIGDVASEIETSPNNLSQVINSKFNKSFFELVSFYRISEAEELIKNTEKSFSEIAYCVGYNSISAFNTSFKKKNGKTPTEYRKGIEF